MLENAIVEQSFKENIEKNELQTVLGIALNMVEKDTESVWVKIYQSKIPPAFFYNNDKPSFFKKSSKALLDDSEAFFRKNDKIPIANFMLGMHYEHNNVMEKVFETYQTGADLGEPYCYIKMAELLIKMNEIANRKIIVYYLLKSFILTSIEGYRYLPESLLIDYSGSYNLDSFWYLSYYFDIHNSDFVSVLDEFFKNEKLIPSFKDALVYIFKHLHNPNEHMNILKLLQDITVNSSDKVSALHLAMFTCYLGRTVNINLEYILTILKVLADDGNAFAAERLALVLEAKEHFSLAAEYYTKSALYLFPTSLVNLGNLFCSVKNEAKSIQLEKANEYWSKAVHFGIYVSIEYLKLLEIRKEFQKLFQLANYSFSCGLYGAELFLGECYEKGRGVEKNLKVALSLYKNGLRKHREGTGFLYRIARIYEKLGYKKFEEFNKLCFNMYYKLYDQDKHNSNNMWILDAYRISSMYAVGRGVKKDIQKSLVYVDKILQANIDTQTSPFLCIFYVAIKRKRDLINLTNNFSSLLSLDEGNSMNRSNVSNSNINSINKSKRSREIFSTNINSSKIELPKTPRDLKSLNGGVSIGDRDNVSMTSINHSDLAVSSTASLLDEVIETIKRDLLTKKNQKKKNSNNVEIVLIEGYIENIKKCGGKVVNIEEVEFGQVIAYGKFSKVYEGTINNTKVAIKDFDLGVGDVKNIFEEINLQISLQDSHINKVLYLGLNANPLRICSINKYMQYNLRYVINEFQLNALQKLFITKQFAEAIVYIHSQSPAIIHRDLKPENILMDDQFNIELCDFGVVSAVQNINGTDDKNFTLKYAAPELVKGSKDITKSSDIWSFGLVLYDLFYERQPWLNLTNEQVIDLIKREKPITLKSDESNNSVLNSINQIIRKCTGYDPAQRPKITSLLEDIFTIIYEFNSA
jgi:hypothetical protein